MHKTWNPGSYIYLLLSWLDFANEDLWRRQSMSTAGMLMADLANAGQANLAAVTAVKGQVWYGCWDSLDLPPAKFLPEIGSTGILKGRDDLADSVAPDLTVSSRCQPLVVVNVAGAEGLLEGVFKMFLWCPSVMIACGEFTIQDYLGQVVPHHHHSGGMPCPTITILEAFPAHCSCDFSNMASMLVISAWSRTLTLET